MQRYSQAIKVSFNNELQDCWNTWLTESLPKDRKQDLLKLYPRPGLLQAPLLNAELSTSVLSKSSLKRDTHFTDYQNYLGSALASLDTAISSLITHEDIDKIEFIKRLGDTGQLIAEVHYSLGVARRAFIKANVSKQTKTILEKTKSDVFLFGPNLSEKIKEGKAIDKLCQDIKPQSAG